MPEPVLPKEYVRALDTAPLESDGEQLNQEVSDYVTSISNKLGWNSNTTTPEEAAQRFMQLRLRQIDATCGSIKWDSGGKYVNSPWYRGIVRPLTLLRDTYHSQLSLAEFESMTPEQAMEALTEPLTPDSAAHIANYLVGPYCEYTNRTDLLDKMAQDVPLQTALKLSPNQSLRKSILQNCYKAQLDLTILHEISARIDDPQLKADINAANILTPNTLQEIVDIRQSNADAQFQTISHFIGRYPTSSFNNIWNDLDTLTSVFPLVDVERLRPLVLQEAMKRGKFGMVRQQNNRWPAILVQNLAVEFIERGRAKLISQEIDASEIPVILDACELVNESSMTDQFVAIQTLNNRYSVPPHFALTSTPITLLKKVLELQPRAYQQKSLIDQISKATGSLLDAEYAKGQFVEFALVDNNFNAAVQFCESMDPHNDATWIAYLQTTRFVSSIWDYTPPKILAKKLELIVKCIEICPAGDMATVLKVYESLNTESMTASVSPPLNTGSSANSSKAGPRTNPKPRKRVQNLLVSGIGWAIGAPQGDNN